MADQPEDLRNIFDATTTRERSTRAQELVATAFGALSKTRARQRLCRDFMLGNVSANLPKFVREAFARHGDGPNAMLEYHAPMALRMPLEQVAEFGAKPPEYRRPEAAKGLESASVSNRIERAAGGVMARLYPYRQSCDLILLDGEAATTTVPSTAHWAMPSDQYEYLTPAEINGLPEDLRELWDWRAEEGDGGRYRRYSRQYRRDRDGRPEWDDEYQDAPERFREDIEASDQAVRDAIELRVRSRIPLEMRLLDFTQMAPLNPRWQGGQLLVDGLAVRESFSGIDLYKRGVRWAKDGPGLIPAETMTSNSSVTLDTVYLTDGDGRPYLIYSVDGARTWRQGEDGDYAETIDLYDQYGLDFLPVGYQYGMHVAAMASPDSRIIPYLYPLVTPFLMRDRLIAMNDFHVGQTACGGWFYEPTKEARDAMADRALPARIEVKQMAVTMVPGKVTPAIHGGAGPGLMVQKQMLDMDIMAAMPSQGGDAPSGIAMALDDRNENRSLSMAWSGIDGLAAQTATNALRSLACLARKVRKAITLNLLTDVPGDQTDSPSSTKSKVVIDADMFGGNYRVETWRPDDWGSNPTKQAMLMDAHDRKKATWTEVRTAVGDSDPMGTLAEIFAEDVLVNTPEGKKMILEDAARLNGDLDRLEDAKLRSEQLIDENGVPMGAAAGVVDPNAALMSETPGGAMPGVTMDVTSGMGINPAQAQLNAVSGGPQASIANIANAGGDVSGLDFGAMGG